MSHAKTIVKNVLYLFNAEIISRVFSLVLIIALSRFLGDIGLGKYSFAFAFVYMFVIFTDFGLSTYVIREVAKDKNKSDKYFNNLIGLKTFLLIIGMILSIVTILFIEKSLEVVIIVALAAIAVLFENLFLTFTTIFISHEKMEYSSWITVTERTLAMVMGFGALFFGYGLKVFIITLILARVITFLATYLIIYKRFLKPKFEFNFKFWGEMIKHAVPFWFTKIFTIIFTKTDTLMLSFMKGYAVVGWYNASLKLVEALYFIPRLITLAIFPAMSKLHLKSKELLNKLYKKSFYYIFTIALPTCIGVSLLADRFIYQIYKDQFLNSVPALQILVWILIFVFVNSVMGYLLNSINKQIMFTMSAGASAIINVILNYILISKHSYVGAASATLISQGINFIILYYLTSSYGYKLNILKLMYKPIIAGICMAAALIYLSKYHLFMLIPIGVIVYFGILLLVKGISREEIELVKGMIYNKLFYGNKGA